MQLQHFLEARQELIEDCSWNRKCSPMFSMFVLSLWADMIFCPAASRLSIAHQILIDSNSCKWNMAYGKTKSHTKRIEQKTSWSLKLWKQMLGKFAGLTLPFWVRYSLVSRRRRVATSQQTFAVVHWIQVTRWMQFCCWDTTADPPRSSAIAQLRQVMPLLRICCRRSTPRRRPVDQQICLNLINPLSSSENIPIDFHNIP